MANDRPKMTNMNTPLGTAKWPKLTEPDYGTNEYPKPDGEYSVKLIFREDDPKFQAFRAEIDKVMEGVIANGETEFAGLKKQARDKLKELTVNQPFMTVYDEDDEPTGEVELKLTMKASGVVKSGPRKGKEWSRKPALFDAFGRPIKKKIAIWGGSELIASVAFDPEGYFIAGTGACGLKMNLNAVQVVTLRQGGEQSADAYGFAAQDDGFAYDENAQEDAAEEDDDEFAGGDDAPEGEDPQGSADF